MNRIGSYNWSKYGTATEIIQSTGFDAYTTPNVPYISEWLLITQVVQFYIIAPVLKENFIWSDHRNINRLFRWSTERHVTEIIIKGG